MTVFKQITFHSYVAVVLLPVCYSLRQAVEISNAVVENLGFPTRMLYLFYISCLRYTILVGNSPIRLVTVHLQRVDNNDIKQTDK